MILKVRQQNIFNFIYEGEHWHRFKEDGSIEDDQAEIVAAAISVQFPHINPEEGIINTFLRNDAFKMMIQLFKRLEIQHFNARHGSQIEAPAPPAIPDPQLGNYFLVLLAVLRNLYEIWVAVYELCKILAQALRRWPFLWLEYD